MATMEVRNLAVLDEHDLGQEVKELEVKRQAFLFDTNSSLIQFNNQCIQPKGILQRFIKSTQEPTFTFMTI